MNGEYLKMMAYFYTNTNRWDLEEAGLIKAGKAGDDKWTRFNHNFDMFILKLNDDQRNVLATMISSYVENEL